MDILPPAPELLLLFRQQGGRSKGMRRQDMLGSAERCQPVQEAGVQDSGLHLEAAEEEGALPNTLKVWNGRLELTREVDSFPFCCPALVNWQPRSTSLLRVYHQLRSQVPQRAECTPNLQQAKLSKALAQK